MLLLIIKLNITTVGSRKNSYWARESNNYSIEAKLWWECKSKKAYVADNYLISTFKFKKTLDFKIIR